MKEVVAPFSFFPTVPSSAGVSFVARVLRELLSGCASQPLGTGWQYAVLVLSAQLSGSLGLLSCRLCPPLSPRVVGNWVTSLPLGLFLVFLSLSQLLS